jgi:hypothetical protein
MKLELHEEAQKQFNERANEFLFELKPPKSRLEAKERRESSASHTYISSQIPEKEIIAFTSEGLIDGFGRQLARYFHSGKTLIGLDENQYPKFVSFIDSIYKRKELNSLLGLEFLIDCGFEWFEKRYKGEIPIETRFFDFLTQKSEQSVRSHKIILPISFLVIELPFQVGKVKFDYFRTDFIDQYVSTAKEHFEKRGDFNEANFQEFERKFRKRYQGTVYASLTLEAEKGKCIEITKEEVQKALMCLRFFSPSVFLPEIPSYVGIMGATNLPKSYSFIFINGNSIPEIQEGIEEKRNFIWSITSPELSEIKKMGLEKASQLIAKNDTSDLESLLLNSMSLFEKGLTSNDYQEKIVYSLVSIETLLLQNQMESIQSNLWLRLAFLAEKEAGRRGRVKDVINEAYKLRSSYVHHGKRKQNWELLRDLQHMIWTAERNILFMTEKYTSQKQLLDYLETKILS